MIRLPFDSGWTVGPKLGVFESPGGEGEPRPVTLPHDAIRDLPRAADSDQGVHTGYYPGGVFEYAKSFEVPHAWREKTVRLVFEGVYRDAVVALNGTVIGHQPHGYAEFSVDLDPFLLFGRSNRVTVVARAHKDSRWYSGAGIYRPVWLVVAEPVHLPLDGTRVTTPDIDAERAIVEVATAVENRTRHTRVTRVAWRIIAPNGADAASASAPVTVLPGERATARVRLAVPDPQLWGPLSPALYRVHAILSDGEGAADSGPMLDDDTVSFGIRRLQLDPQHGLRVNGEVVKLRGACVHHDNGPLGAASYASAEDRRVRLLKEAGFSALRSAHNPMSRAMLDACDRHGVLVMDELTDVWTVPKTSFDASVTFAERWAEDVAGLVAKDVNHPSVVMYSIGNEILELTTPGGRAWGRRLAAAVRELDDTRFVTNGINGVISNLDLVREAMAEAAASDPNTMMADMGTQMAAANASEAVGRSIEEAASVLDVVGLNYGEARYRLDATQVPHRVIVGSETFPARIDALWALVAELPHVIGDFTWTGWDYLGEAGIGRVGDTDADGDEPTGTAGPYPYLTAECGDLDITGYRRTISYWREIVYGLRREPYIAVHRPQRHGRASAATPWSWDDSVASWSWAVPAGSPVTVDVYADAEEVELVRDGVSLGVAPVAAVGGGARGFVATFETEYRPGELVAIARRAGTETGRASLRSASGPLRLSVELERPALDALAYLAITLRDAVGTVPCDADVVVSVAIAGGELAGLGTGRARTLETFCGPAVTTYDGRALAIVRVAPPGAEVVVSADGFEPVRVHIPR